MRRSARRVAPALAFVLFALTLATPLAARDFPVPLAMANPLRAAGGVADFGYHDNTFASGPYDLFSVRQRITVAAELGRRFAVGAHWATYLMVGPVPGSEEAFSIARWVMNTVQFEYAIAAAYRVGRVDVIASYGRTSQHPLASGGFSEVASDIVEIGVGLPVVVLAGLGRHAAPPVIATGVRLAYLDLYDFWQSPLLAPRTLLRLETPVQATVPLGRFARLADDTTARRPRPESARAEAARTIALVARAWPRLLVLRQEGAWPNADVDPPVQMEIDAELGFRLAGPRSYAELLLEFFTTQDTERRRGEPTPLTTFGITARMGLR